MKIKSVLNFWKYYESEEKEGGDYWIFANLSDEELKEMVEEQKSKRNYDFLFWGKIIEKIQNENLKKKIIENYKKMILYTQDLDYIVENHEFFSEEELKNLVDLFLEKKISEQDYRVDTLRLLQSIKITDIKWLTKKCDQIFNSLGKYEKEDVEYKNASFFLKIHNFTIFQELMKRYKDQLPKEFFKYLEVTVNREYVEEKAREYRNEKLGIDPKINLGLEIELNNKMDINFRVNEQNGLEQYRIAKDPTVIPRYGSSVSINF